jgi:chromosome condensin MukBEF MukE localization factor
MQETEDMINGKIPCTWYQSPEELVDALKKVKP